VLGIPVGVKGTVWRTDPLDIKVSGFTVSASLHMLYRMRIAIGSQQVASCGYNEAPRDVTVKFTGRFAYAPGWYIDPTFDIAVTTGEPCRATALSFDITPSIAGEIERSLQEYADAAEESIRKYTNMRAPMDRLWTGIDEPMAIAPATWLEVNPIKVTAASIFVTDDQRYLALPIALDARPTVIVGARPVRRSVPLPALAAGDTRPDFSIAVRGLVTYDKASTLLTEMLRREQANGSLKSLDSVRIESATVRGSGEKVVISVEVRGLFTGTLHLFGTPRFEARTDGAAGGTLIIDNIDYTIETRSFIARLGNAIFGNRIRATLREFSSFDVTNELQTATDELSRALNRDLGTIGRLNGRLSSFGPGGVRVGPEGIEAWYRVSGTLDVAVNPF
jgi:hypothetical protein